MGDGVSVWGNAVRVAHGAARSDTAVRRLLDGAPKPMINPQDRIVALWAPKSACTVVLVWHLSRLGLVQAAAEHHRWPHTYRLQVLEKGEERRRAVAEFDPAAYTVVRFVRDPFKRAVSAYRQSLKHKLMPKASGPLRFLRRHRLDAHQGYSFVQFLETLAAWPPERVDVHLRPQKSPLEDLMTPRFTINADHGSLTDQINAMELTLGLVPTDFAALDWLRGDAARRHARIKDGVPAVPGSHAETVFAAGAMAGDWPAYDCFRSERAEDLVRKVFAVDVAAYGMLP